MSSMTSDTLKQSQSAFIRTLFENDDASSSAQSRRGPSAASKSASPSTVSNSG